MKKLLDRLVMWLYDRRFSEYGNDWGDPEPHIFDDGHARMAAAVQIDGLLLEHVNFDKWKFIADTVEMYEKDMLGEMSVKNMEPVGHWDAHIHLSWKARKCAPKNS